LSDRSLAQPRVSQFPIDRNRGHSPAGPRRVEVSVLGAIPVSVALHGQKTDRRERSEKNARCKTGVLQLAESANIQHARLHVGGCFAGLLIRIKQRPADLKCTRPEKTHWMANGGIGNFRATGRYLILQTRLRLGRMAAARAAQTNYSDLR
jgi:hypothetical protein